MPELAEEIRAAAATVGALVTASEARIAYRVEHGRSLSAAHKEALGALLVALDGLRGRVVAVLDPPPTGEELRQQFEAACARLEEMEVER
jgi:hypothetical protein